MRLRTLILALTLACVVLPSCKNDDDVNGGSTSGEFTATIDGQTGTAQISSQTATTKSDGGLRMEMIGLTSSADDLTISISIAGGADVDLQPQSDPEAPPSATLQIGSSDINFTMDVGSDRYRGTGGTITFTAYDPVPDGSVTGSFDAELVTTSLSDPKSASISGDFDLVVEAPTPTPTPTP